MRRACLTTFAILAFLFLSLTIYPSDGYGKGVVGGKVDNSQDRESVNMDKGKEGDLFVDEDGDGIDDRRMRERHRRGSGRWDEDDQGRKGPHSDESGRRGGRAGHGEEEKDQMHGR